LIHKLKNTVRADFLTAPASGAKFNLILQRRDTGEILHHDLHSEIFATSKAAAGHHTIDRDGDRLYAPEGLVKVKPREQKSEIGGEHGKPISAARLTHGARPNSAVKTSQQPRWRRSPQASSTQRLVGDPREQRRIMNAPK
jgi:hypothetical protein